MPKVTCLVAALSLLNTVGVARGEEEFALGPLSQVQANIPHGTVTKHRWTSPTLANTVRDYWLYVPAQYDPNQPACVMVFQDGKWYVDAEGQFRAPVVFDNLIHTRQMPVTIGVFINPGEFPLQAGQDKPASNRSVEYDTLSDAYARFLLDEFLPHLGKTYKLSSRADDRAICGISSGGICAFTVAWERPDAFSKVLSHVGSFVNIRGGHVYPALIRKTPAKPIRVFLQGGSEDLDNEHGNWPLANQEMAAALKFAKYDYRLEFGGGGHNGKHGGAILPESLVWLWRGHPQVKAAE